MLADFPGNIQSFVSGSCMLCYPLLVGVRSMSHVHSSKVCKNFEEEKAKLAVTAVCSYFSNTCFGTNLKVWDPHACSFHVDGSSQRTDCDLFQNSLMALFLPEILWPSGQVTRIQNFKW